MTGQKIHGFITCIEIIDHDCDVGSGFQPLLATMCVKVDVGPYVVPQCPSLRIMLTESFLQALIQFQD